MLHYMEGQQLTHRAATPPLSASVWVLAVLGIGALLGIGTAAALLAHKDRPLPDDPDEPLFI